MTISQPKIFVSVHWVLNWYVIWLSYCQKLYKNRVIWTIQFMLSIYNHKRDATTLRTRIDMFFFINKWRTWFFYHHFRKMKNLMFCLTGLSKTIFMFQNETKHITVNQRVDEEKKVKSWTTNTDKHILPACSHAATM